MKNAIPRKTTILIHFNFELNDGFAFKYDASEPDNKAIDEKIIIV